MLKINKFFLSDVRCFKGEKEFNIRPLTLLIGENSTGKTTVLGCLWAMNQFVFQHGGFIDFNIPPYKMGGFEDICRRAKPKNTSFKLGFEVESNEDAVPNFKFELIFGEQLDRALPVVKEARLIFDDGEIRFIHKEKLTSPIGKEFEFNLTKERNKKVFTIVSSSEVLSFALDYARVLESRLRLYRIEERSEKLNSVEEQLYEFMKNKNYGHLFANLNFRYSSIPPIRSEPEGTYDPLYDSLSDIEIPVILRNLSFKKGKDWEQLKEKLIEFGKHSGLFTNIQVKNLGNSLSAPFQLKFNIRGAQATNLIDVGYGISQILPILVYVLMTKNHTFLMQQPEVHLHPKAQAVLTSLFIELTKQRNNNFIIETHSDHMIDRARIEIMKGKIKPEDVSLIYLEAKGKDVEVYNLGFDRQANFLPDPPINYRNFLLKEEDALLGWDD